MTTTFEGTEAPAAGASASPGGAGQARVNLGCGATVHPAFVNIDLVAAPGVMTHDLRLGIPFPDASFDLVYHSTMLSHLRTEDALRLTKECHRVLKPGGVLRVVTEDLERMCRVYLQKLEAVCNGDRASLPDYEWMIIELYDQATREYSGGRLAEFLRQDPLPNEGFVYSRIGEQGRRMVSRARARARGGQAAPRRSLRDQVGQLKVKAMNVALKVLLSSEDRRALDIGRFRLQSGQVSYRMYDRCSLEQLFRSGGFSNATLRSAEDSGYPFWNEVNLDVSAEGEPARPHALIMESVRS